MCADCAKEFKRRGLRLVRHWWEDIRICLATDAVAIDTTNAQSQQKQLEFG